MIQLDFHSKTAFEVHYKLYTPRMHYVIFSCLYCSNPLEGGIGFLFLCTLLTYSCQAKITQSSKVEISYDLLSQADLVVHYHSLEIKVFCAEPQKNLLMKVSIIQINLLNKFFFVV